MKNRSTIFILILSVLACFGLFSGAQADDEDLGGGNSGAGFNALLNLSTGGFNSAFGWNSQFRLTSGFYNTAFGAGSLALNTADSNTAVGAAALLLNTSGTQNVAVGTDALVLNDSASSNTAIGYFALFNNNTGDGNTANGAFALEDNTTGSFNMAMGLGALGSNTTGFSNTATGNNALFANTTGGNNIALGNSAGNNLTTGDNNIDIGNSGVADEANTIRIGTSETQTATFIAGIHGATTSDAGSTVPVLVDMNGNLGTAASSERFKTEIKPMDASSEMLLALKPVRFKYKSDSKGTPQFGLIAEEVAKVNPDLVVRDAKGTIYTVRYEAVNAMLLNEFLKEHKTVQEQGATIACLQKQIETLTAGLQKVNAQLELNRRAPQTVLNNQ